MQNKERNILIISIILVAIILGLGAGLFSTVSVQSVSSATLDGKDARLINFYAGTGGDVINAIITPSVPGWNSQQSVQVGASLNRNIVEFTSADLTGTSGTISRLDYQFSCNDFFSCSLQGGWEGFSSKCAQKANEIAGTSSPYYVVADVSPISTTYTKFVCYAAKPFWIVSRFNSVPPTVTQNIDVTFTKTDTSGSSVGGSYKLSNVNGQTQPIVVNNVKIGEVRVVGQGILTSGVPDASAVEMIRTVDGGSRYLVDAGIRDDGQSYKAAFVSCMTTQAKNIQRNNLPFLNLDLFASGPYNEAPLATCVNDYAMNIENMWSVSKPTGIYAYGKANTSALQSTGRFSIENKYTQPQLNMYLYADSIGITRPLAVPANVQLQPISVLDSNNIQTLQTTVRNSGVTGSMQWSLTCVAPFSPIVYTSDFSIDGGQTKTFPVQISSGTINTTSSCTICLTDANGGNKNCSTQTYLKQAECNMAVPEGSNAYVDRAACRLVCPITSCPTGSTPHTPATGYASECSCVAGISCQPWQTLQGTSCVNKCNTTQNYNTNTGMCDNIVIPPQPCVGSSCPSNQTCMAIFEKPTTMVVGGFNVPILGNIFGQSVTTCTWNYTNIGFITLAIAAMFFFVGERNKKKDYKNIGMALGGFALILVLLSFVAEQSLLLFLGGAGIFVVIAAVIVLIFVIKGQVSAATFGLIK